MAVQSPMLRGEYIKARVLEVSGEGCFPRFCETDHIQRFTFCFINRCRIHLALNGQGTRSKIFLFNFYYSVNFLLGILAGASAVILTQPADVLRCHLQIDQRIGLENFKSHIRERGILKALYLDGIGPRITRRTLVSAINWTIFEELKRRL